MYRTDTYDVNPSTGAVGSYTLYTLNWYDQRGNVIETQAPGGLVTKDTYDGAGRLTMEYQTDGGGGTGYAAASSVSSDTVLTQTAYTYDSDGNLTETVTRDRFDSATGTGALGTPTTGINARVYYMGYYYNVESRQIASVNVGTNGGSAWTMPGSEPSRSSTVLVTSTSYAADAVQDVALTGGPTGGTFTLSFGGDTTSAIAYNASASTVQSGAQALGVDRERERDGVYGALGERLGGMVHRYAGEQVPGGHHGQRGRADGRQFAGGVGLDGQFRRGCGLRGSGDGPGGRGDARVHGCRGSDGADGAGLHQRCGDGHVECDDRVHVQPGGDDEPDGVSGGRGRADHGLPVRGDNSGGQYAGLQ